jgi:hypothetical protein
MVGLSNSKVRESLNYRVGYCEKLQKYILAYKVTNWIIDYERWFEISEEEFEQFKNGSDEMDVLKNNIINDLNSERFVFSWKKDENTEDKLKKLHEFKIETGGENYEDNTVSRRMTSTRLYKFISYSV